MEGKQKQFDEEVEELSNEIFKKLKVKKIPRKTEFDVEAMYKSFCEEVLKKWR